MFDFIKNISSTELIIVLIILTVIFGAKIITGLGKTGGETVKEIKKIKKEFTKAIEIDDNEPGKN